jgi:hypothetical protein
MVFFFGFGFVASRSLGKFQGAAARPTRNRFLLGSDRLQAKAIESVEG